MKFEDYMLIIDEIKISKSLKGFIINNRFQFSDNEMIYLIYIYSLDFDSKLKLLNLMHTITEANDTKNRINISLEYLTRAKELFLKHEEDYIYELHIQDLDYPSDDEHYLSRTFKGAMDRIDGYFEHFKDIDLKETNQTRYSVIKRSIKDYTSINDFDSDELGECQLGPGKTTQTFDYWPLRNYGTNEDGTDNDQIWESIESIEVDFPNFIKGYSLISYSDYWHKKNFGIVVPFSENSTLLSDLYVLPISREIYEVANTEQTNETNIHDFHEHIEIAKIEIEDINEVDDFTKECHALLKKLLT
ncbi:MAG: hypothetical protein KKH01_09790 [Firmicutes bacterium]|nr:hypothetical protein [Bacillota bacterium]